MTAYLTKQEALDRLERIRAVIARLPDDAEILEAEANSTLVKPPSIFLIEGVAMFAEREGLDMWSEPSEKGSGYSLVSARTAEDVTLYEYVRRNSG